MVVAVWIDEIRDIVVETFYIRVLGTAISLLDIEYFIFTSVAPKNSVNYLLFYQRN
jgi:hypothetical protein